MNYWFKVWLGGRSAGVVGTWMGWLALHVLGIWR